MSIQLNNKLILHSVPRLGYFHWKGYQANHLMKRNRIVGKLTSLFPSIQQALSRKESTSPETRKTFSVKCTSKD